MSAKEIFTAALAIEDAKLRQQYLRHACGKDAALRQSVERLLAALPEAGVSPLDAFVKAFGPEQSMLPTVSMEAPSEPSGPREIGPYKLLEQIGQGAFGTVYMAEQTKPVRRQVALKILKPGMDSKEVIARFEAERQALAMMDHPHISRVLDGGTTETGRLYFVMELVRGVPLTEYCDEARLTTVERLELFIDVCRAVQHAHQKGIIHRDLKPGNVLVTMHDDKAVVKVIDFGIAKAINQRLTDRTLFTGYQQMLGTPLYMSPEQAQMSGIDVDTRSDVYSLGVILYELLTGTTPFTKESLSSAGFDEFRRIIREQDPPRPSARLTTLDAKARSTIADRRRIDQRKVSQELRGELDWIVMKALEKDRTRRYESASAFAADVQRHLNDEPVWACPPSVAYRLSKYCRRNRGLVTMAGFIAATFLIATGVSLSYAIQTEYEKSQAVAAHEQSGRNLMAALNAVEKLLQHASNPQLKELPRAQPFLKEMVADSLKFYDQFPITSDDSPALRFRAAETRSVLSDLADSLGDADLGIRIGQEALVEYARLVKESPSNNQFRESQARLLEQLGWVYCRSLQDFERGGDCFQRAYRIYQGLAESTPGDTYQVQLGETLAALATSYQFRGNDEEYRRLVMRAYEDHGRAHEYVTTILSREDPDQAEPLWPKIISAARERVAADGQRAQRVWYVGQLLLGVEFFRDREKETANALLEEAVDLSADMIEEFPELVWNQDAIRNALRVRLKVLSEESSGSEQQRVFEELLAKYSRHTRDALHDEYAWNLSGTADAITVLTTMVQKYPQQSSYEFALGCALRGVGRVQEGQVHIDRAFDIDPGDLPMHRRCAGFLYAQPDAIQALTHMIERFPEIDCYYHYRGSRYRFSATPGQFDGAIEKALADYSLALKNQKAHTENWIRYDIAWAKGDGHFHKAEFAEALVDYTEALDHLPNNMYILQRRAVAFFKLNRFDEALADLEAFSKNERRNLDCLTAIPPEEVAACPSEEFRQNMRALADRLVARKRHSAESLAARASLLLALGDRDAANADLSLVVSDPQADYYPLYQAALLALKAGDEIRYQELCRRMLRDFQESKSVQAVHFAGWTCALAPDAVTDFPAAIQFARRAAAQEPARRQYLMGLGAILMRSGHWEQAKSELERAMATDDADGTSIAYIRYFLAMTEHHLGHQQAAREQLRLADTSSAEELAESPAWNRKLTLELLRNEATELIGEPAGATAATSLESAAPQATND